MMSGGSRIIPKSLSLVEYHELNHGHLTLHMSKDLPAVVGANEAAFVGKIVSEASQWQHRRDGIERPLPPIAEMDVAVHTGGPRVINGVAEALGCHDDRTRASWMVMRANGNLSGASNLAVLHQQNELTDGRDWVLCLSMGPGMCLEGLVLRRPNA